MTGTFLDRATALSRARREILDRVERTELPTEEADLLLDENAEASRALIAIAPPGWRFSDERGEWAYSAGWLAP